MEIEFAGKRQPNGQNDQLQAEVEQRDFLAQLRADCHIGQRQQNDIADQSRDIDGIKQVVVALAAEIEAVHKAGGDERDHPKPGQHDIQVRVAEAIPDVVHKKRGQRHAGADEQGEQRDGKQPRNALATVFIEQGFSFCHPHMPLIW